MNEEQIQAIDDAFDRGEEVFLSGRLFRTPITQEMWEDNKDWLRIWKSLYEKSHSQDPPATPQAS